MFDGPLDGFLIAIAVLGFIALLGAALPMRRKSDRRVVRKDRD